VFGFFGEKHNLSSGASPPTPCTKVIKRRGEVFSPGEKRRGEPGEKRRGEVFSPGEKRRGEPGEKRRGEPGEKRRGEPGEKRRGEPGEKRRGEVFSPGEIGEVLFLLALQLWENLGDRF
jgi:hypothetical protein